MKQLLIILGISLTIILIPSFLISAGLTIFFGHFWYLFLVAVGTIFVIGELSNRYFQTKILADIQNFKAKIEQLRSEQSVVASCAYCKQRLTIPVKLSQRTTYECPHCKQTNLVVFQFTTAQITTPLELPQLGSMSTLQGQAVGAELPNQQPNPSA